MKDEVYTVTIQAFKTVNGKTYATPKAKIQCFNQARIKETSIKVKKGRGGYWYRAIDPPASC